MKNARFADFPENEYKWRIMRGAELLKEENLDGLILTQMENVYYTTGIHHVDVLKSIKDMSPTASILTRDQGAIIVGRWPASSFMMEETCWPEIVVSYGGRETPAEAIARALQEYGLSGGRVGMELDGGTRLNLSIYEFEALRRKASGLGVEIADCSPVIWRLRGVKSNFEIERLRKSYHATCKALEYAMENVKIGDNQIELALKAGKVMMENGAYWYNTQVLHPSFEACIAIDDKVPAGYVCFDFGAEHRHYITDMHRMVLLGSKPTEREREVYDVRVKANEIIQKSVKPGKSFEEVIMELKSFIEESGCVMPVNQIGHGIGLEVHEPPKIAVSTEPEPYSGLGTVGYLTKFEVGMVFTLEPSIRDAKLPVFFNCEDDVVVTEIGCELLEDFPREMRIKL